MLKWKSATVGSILVLKTLKSNSCGTERSNMALSLRTGNTLWLLLSLRDSPRSSRSTLSRISKTASQKPCSGSFLRADGTAGFLTPSDFHLFTDAEINTNNRLWSSCSVRSNQPATVIGKLTKSVRRYWHVFLFQLMDSLVYVLPTNICSVLACPSLYSYCTAKGL